jgi:predicted Ser/Thr protein kinase
MGSVYLAEDPRLKRRLAVKVVRLDTIRSETERQEFLARFQREAEVSGVLNDPGIVTIYDVGESEMGPFLAMEFVPGKPLDAVLKGGEPLSLKDKLGIAAGLAAALDHAHSKGIVHRDVKPGNVMLTADHKPKLMDFGIAKRDDTSLTQTGTFLGTPSYASPEQIKEGAATGLSDVFSFGVLTFELLSGSLPFPGTSINTILYKIVNEPPASIVPPVEGLVPEGWQRIFNKVLAKNPQDRHPSCSAFVRELLDTAMDLGRTERMQLLGGLRPGDPSAPAAGAATLASPAGSRNRTLLWSGLGGGLAAALLAGFLLFRRGPVQVLIDSDPASATVLKDGKAVGATPVSLALQAGESISLEHKGFQPMTYRYRAGEAPGRLQLEPVKSEETLQTDPPGATVVLDAVKLDGVTPLKVPAWNQGQKHDLTFTKGSLVSAFSLAEGETPGTRVFTLGSAAQPRDTAVPRSVDANAPGSLRFAAEYPVRVKLDGRELGELHGSLVPAAPGSHRLELSSPKVFFKEARTVTVGPGQTVNVPLPATVRLTVETFPNSGTVLLDGLSTQVESDGSTPITVTRGPHTVAIQGHPGSARPVDLQADTPLRFKL